MGASEAFFLPTHPGRRFCLLYPAAANIRGAMLYVHPFAEEMNKSRRMAALQARALADAGWAVLQMDLHGCGDSEGDFGDADWQTWVRDVELAARWLAAKTGHPPSLWGLRAGCLIAAHAARNLEPAPDLLLWQPVLSGKHHLQQFLRMKVTGQLLVTQTRGGGGTAELREQLRRGETVEIAGYALSPGLASGLDAAELDRPAPPARVAWLEIASGSNAQLPPAARGSVERWRAAGTRVGARTVEGPAFWQSLEITECPTLIAATLSSLEEWQS